MVVVDNSNSFFIYNEIYRVDVFENLYHNILVLGLMIKSLSFFLRTEAEAIVFFCGLRHSKPTKKRLNNVQPFYFWEASGDRTHDLRYHKPSL